MRRFIISALVALTFTACAARQPKPPQRPEDVKPPSVGAGIGALLTGRVHTNSWKRRNLQASKNVLGVTELRQRVEELEDRLAALEQCECRAGTGAPTRPPVSPRANRCMKDCFETFGDNVLVKADRAACEDRCR